MNISADRILKYLSLMSIFLIIDGVGYNVFFYQQFNIEITDYIDLAESLQLFIPNAIVVLLASIPSATAYVFVVRYFDLHNERRAQVNPVNNTWGSIIFSNLFGLIIGIGGVYLFGLLFKSDEFSEIWLKAILFPACYLALDIYRKLKDQFTFHHGIAKFILINTIIFIFYLVFFTIDNAKKIKNGKGKYDIALTMKTSPMLRTDSTSVYIGQSRNYVFLYNLKRKESSVISKSEINQIQIIHKLAPKYESITSN
jgi:hypothetical protein